MSLITSSIKPCTTLTSRLSTFGRRQGASGASTFGRFRNVLGNGKSVPSWGPSEDIRTVLNRGPPGPKPAPRVQTRLLFQDPNEPAPRPVARDASTGPCHWKVDWKTAGLQEKSDDDITKYKTSLMASGVSSHIAAYEARRYAALTALTAKEEQTVKDDCLPTLDGYLFEVTEPSGNRTVGVYSSVTGWKHPTDPIDPWQALKTGWPPKSSTPSATSPPPRAPTTTPAPKIPRPPPDTEIDTTSKPGTLLNVFDNLDSAYASMKSVTGPRRPRALHLASCLRSFGEGTRTLAEKDGDTFVADRKAYSTDLREWWEEALGECGHTEDSNVKHFQSALDSVQEGYSKLSGLEPPEVSGSDNDWFRTVAGRSWAAQQREAWDSVRTDSRFNGVYDDEADSSEILLPESDEESDKDGSEGESTDKSTAALGNRRTSSPRPTWRKRHSAADSTKTDPSNGTEPRSDPTVLSTAPSESTFRRPGRPRKRVGFIEESTGRVGGDDLRS